MATRIGTNQGETLRGTSGTDVLDGRGGNDRLFGLGGNDFLFGGTGANLADGGAGRDAVGFAFDDEDDDGATGSLPIEADLAARTYTAGGAVTRLASIEDATGGDVDDTLAGDGRANLLRGLDGDDTLIGRGGNDTLIGHRGADTIFGGGGADLVATFFGTGDEPDEVHGGAGNDRLRLAGHGDQVWGDAGADRFEAAVVVTGDVAGPLFTIRDFGTASGDVIVLPVFSNPDGTDETQPYTFVGGGPLEANGVAEVRFGRRGDDTVVQYETTDNADPGQSVNEILLTGRLRLTAGDFVLDAGGGAAALDGIA